MKLGGRRGEMIKVFDIFVDAAKKGDVLAMDSIFHVSTAHLSGFYLSSYKFDLFEIFKTNPKFFLERGKIFFKDKGTCNMYWLLPRTGEVSLKEVQGVLRKYPELLPETIFASKFSKLSEKERNKATRHCYKINIPKNKKQKKK